MVTARSTILGVARVRKDQSEEWRCRDQGEVDLTRVRPSKIATAKEEIYWVFSEREVRAETWVQVRAVSAQCMCWDSLGQALSETRCDGIQARDSHFLIS